MKKFFVGIDFSKRRMDVSIVEKDFPEQAIAQGKRSDTLGFPHNWVSAPCKGKSFNPLCCYSCLIADLAVLKWNTVCTFCSILAPCLKAFALTGRDCSNTRYPGCRFACPGLCAPLGFQPALVKSETWVTYRKVPSRYVYFHTSIFSHHDKMIANSLLLIWISE